ncbi:MAG: tetratricopeptide repeat protein [Myxococcota bacterium]
MGWVTPAAAQEEDATDPAEEAVRLFEESRDLYQEGRFEDAADRLRRAYELDPAPVLLFNLARACEEADDLECAVDSYQRYLDAEPDLEDRGAIEARIRRLNQRIEEAQRPAPPAVVTVEPSKPSPVPWVVAGVGVASVVVGIVFGVMANSSHDDAVAEASFVPAQEAQDEAERNATIANITLIAGGIVAGAGLVWGIIDVLSSGGEPEERSIDVALSPTGVSVSGSW